MSRIRPLSDESMALRVRAVVGEAGVAQQVQAAARRRVPLVF